MNPQTLHASLLFASICLIALVGVITMMIRGWNRRRHNQQILLGDFPSVPTLTASPIRDCLDGLYLGCTIVPSWNNRVVIGDLGYPAQGQLIRYSQGILVKRHGEDSSLWIPQESIIGIRTESGIGGRVISSQHNNAVVVIRWSLPSGVELDTGFRTRNRVDYTHLLEEQHS